MSARVVGIIQARMGSSRLPGKVLLDIEGEAMLGRVVTRASRSRMLHEVLVATTSDPDDDVIVDYCKGRGIPTSRGSKYDVLDRYYHAAAWTRADAVVRITADCPFLDPSLVDDVVRTLLGTPDGEAQGAPHPAPPGFDFAANRLPPPWKRTYPIGLDAEACTFGSLQRAWTEARQPQEREHVMPYLYENVSLAPAAPCLSIGTSPRGFRVALLDHGVDLGNYRWTVDTPEDLAFARAVYRNFAGRSDFTWQQVLELVVSQPQLSAINAGVRHKTLGEVDGRASGNAKT